MQAKCWTIFVVVAVFQSCGVGEATVGDDSDWLEPEETEQISDALCPSGYAPVCGWNGRSYANDCLAGGPSKVMHRGACSAAEVAACAQRVCPVSTHCEVRGLNGGVAGVCIANPPQSCATASCRAGYHCEMRGINGGSVPVCIVNPPTSNCNTLHCGAGYHCEMRGINGGSVPVCIANSTPPTSCTGYVCGSGHHCELRSANGSPSAPTCVPNPVSACQNVQCGPGQHCEEKGLNGGTVGICIRN